MKEKIVLYVDKMAFCRWYFDSRDMYEDVVNDLVEKGQVILKDYLDGLGYIPSYLILNIEDVKEEDKGEIDDDYFEIEEPSPRYELKFKEAK